MKSKVWIPIQLIGGFLLITGVYLAIKNVNAFSSLEQAEAIITGFHTHEDAPYDYHANISFLHNGDSISLQLGHYNQNLTIGQIIVVSFPAGEPNKAELKTKNWFGAALLILIGISWLATMWFIRYLQQKTKVTTTIKGIANAGAKPKSWNSELPLLLLFSLLAIILTGLAIVFIRAKLNNPDSSTEWGGLILLAVLAFLFVAGVSGGWRSQWVRSKSLHVDAEFVRVTPPQRTVTATGKVKYTWKLDCEWTDSRTGKKLLFTSEPFEGAETWYNRNKIQVLVYPKKPVAYYTVDLAFISSTNQSGIVLVDEKMMAMIQEAEEKLQQKQNTKFEP